jgi:hypothetical protein
MGYNQGGVMRQRRDKGNLCTLFSYYKSLRWLRIGDKRSWWIFLSGGKRGGELLGSINQSGLAGLLVLDKELNGGVVVHDSWIIVSAMDFDQRELALGCS